MTGNGAGMIEDAMLFALGACVATLLALLCLPAVWARALRLTRRRLEMLVPLSASEISGERDGVRAEAAVVQRRLEQRLEKAELAAAEVAVHLGRRTADLVAAGEARDAALADGKALTAELGRSTASLVTTEAQCGALQLELGHLEAHLARIKDECGEALERVAEHASHLEQNRGELAALETKNAGLSAQFEDRGNDIEHLRSEHDALQVGYAKAMEERDAARRDVLLEVDRRRIVQQQFKDEISRTADRSVRMQAKSEALARAERQIMEQAAEIKASATALAHLKQRFQALQLRLIARVAGPGLDASLSHDELLDLRKDIINAADDALLLLHNPVPANLAPMSAIQMPAEAPAPRSVEARL